MDSWECSVLNCDSLSTTAPETQLNLQMSTPTVKQEKVECIDEEELPCSDNMYPSESLESSQYINYYDSKGLVADNLKKELPEAEYLQSDFSINYTNISENKVLIKRKDKQGVKHENTEEGLPLITKEENINNQVIVKIEGLEEQDILDNTEATSIHYDVLVTPQEVQCKLCDRIFKNSFNLLKHNNEHIKIEINTRADNELHQCQYCDKRYDNYNNMLAHVNDVHSVNNLKCEICGKQFNSLPNLKRHFKLAHKLMYLPNQVTPDDTKCIYCNVDFENIYELYKHMKLCRTGKVDEEMKYKCDSCERVYSLKCNLIKHIKRTHYDYGRTFECWCGEQFRTPIHLTEHEKYRHSANGNNEAHKCEHCEAVYSVKPSLIRHMKMVHYDYGRTFECWCGEQFRSPVHLVDHKRYRHSANGKNEVHKCEQCGAVFSVKLSLIHHVKRVHHVYGKTFECWCGKQFPTPIHLSDHKTSQHGKNMVCKCKYCGALYKGKKGVSQHIKIVHEEYGRRFKCGCGNEFRTPIHLKDHIRRQHCGKMKDTNNDKVQCDCCQIKFKTKHSLIKHIKNIHY